MCGHEVSASGSLSHQPGPFVWVAKPLGWRWISSDHESRSKPPSYRTARSHCWSLALFPGCTERRIHKSNYLFFANVTQNWRTINVFLLNVCWRFEDENTRGFPPHCRSMELMVVEGLPVLCSLSSGFPSGSAGVRRCWWVVRGGRWVTLTGPQGDNWLLSSITHWAFQMAPWDSQAVATWLFLSQNSPLRGHRRDFSLLLVFVAVLTKTRLPAQVWMCVENQSEHSGVSLNFRIE